MEPEVLLAAVQKRSSLYDKTDLNYSNRNFINAEWKKVGEEIGVSDDDARKRWKKMRDYFQKCHREMSSLKSGSGGGKKRKWFLYDSLLFLVPHLNDRKTETNMPESSDEDLPDVDVSMSQASSPSTQLPPTPATSQEAPASTEEANGEDTTSTTENPRPQQGSTNRRRRPKFPHERHSQADIDSEMLKAITTLGQRTAAQTAQTPHEDEDEYFFKNLIPKMKLLNTVDKVECQADIHLTVLKYIKRNTESAYHRPAERSTSISPQPSASGYSSASYPYQDSAQASQYHQQYATQDLYQQY